tara:strand:- start:307 stop:618 length:312 start_codon:yes stop_codon:yes gene_type:complete
VLTGDLGICLDGKKGDTAFELKSDKSISLIKLFNAVLLIALVSILFVILFILLSILLTVGGGGGGLPLGGWGKFVWIVEGGGGGGGCSINNVDRRRLKLVEED